MASHLYDLFILKRAWPAVSIYTATRRMNGDIKLDKGGWEMKRRKMKWPKGKKPQLHQGGVLTESCKLSIDDVIAKVEREGRRMTTRLVDTNDPYNLRGRYWGGSSADFRIHLADKTLISETEITVILHVDDQVFVDLDADNFSSLDDFIGDGDVIRGWLEIVGWVVMAQLTHYCTQTTFDTCHWTWILKALH